MMHDSQHSSEVFEIPWVSDDLLSRGRNCDGLFPDGTKGRIARNDGILEITDDKMVALENASTPRGGVLKSTPPTP